MNVHSPTSRSGVPTAIVTGVTSAIGAAIAVAMARRGFRVFGTTRRPASPTLTIEDTSIEVLALDVTDTASVTACVASILALTGRIDVLVNNAGVTMVGAVEETLDDEARPVIETNLLGVHRMARAVLPAMRHSGSGRIVTVGSVAGFLPKPFEAFYSATKHAVEGYMESLHHEVRDLGIHVSIIEPGYVRTDLAAHAASAAQRIGVYAEPRELIADNLARCIAAGVEPAVVARWAVRAATSRWPRLRYRAGLEARIFRLERTLTPQRLFDGGVAIHFFGLMYRLRAFTSARAR